MKSEHYYNSEFQIDDLEIIALTEIGLGDVSLVFYERNNWKTHCYQNADFCFLKSCSDT